MNKVVTINLNGNAFQLEEGGYEALRAYLDAAARRLEGNPDRDEIIADIEQAIADKCRTVLGAYKTVVGTKEVAQIIEEMGPVEDASAESEPNPAAGGAAARAAAETRSESADTEAKATTPLHRLYRIPEGAMIGGVCNGLAARFNIDVTLVRLAFVVLCWFWCSGALVYAVLMFLLPTADTTTEKAAAYGVPSTAQDFIRRAKAGYYEGMKTFADKQAHREWRRRFRREMRGWRRTFQNEMRGHARSWRSGWASGSPPEYGAWLALPFVSLLRTGLALLWIVALVSLLATGTVFGIQLPIGLPVWGGVLGLLVLYHLLVWPLKAMRRAYYWNAAGGPFGAPPFLYVFDSFVRIAFVVLLLWLAVHHLPQIHEACRHLPSLIHEAVDDVRSWWAQQ